MTDNAWLTCFSKSGERVVARVKGAEYKYVQGYQYYEEELIMRERDHIRTERPSVRNSITNG